MAIKIAYKTNQQNKHSFLIFLKAQNETQGLQKYLTSGFSTSTKIYSQHKFNSKSQIHRGLVIQTKSVKQRMLEAFTIDVQRTQKLKTVGSKLSDLPFERSWHRGYSERRGGKSVRTGGTEMVVTMARNRPPDTAGAGER